MKRLLILWIVLLSIHISAQSPICGATTGSITRETYSSSAVGQTMFYSVYTPPCYDAVHTPYPVIYLMHGSNDDDGQWQRLGLIDLLDEKIISGEIVPLVVVMPFGNVIANRNRFDMFSWNHAFLTELMPDAEAKYAISTDKATRAIGGISRGGFWAYQIAFANPNLFSAVGGHSAFFDLYHAEESVNPLDLALDSPTIESMQLWLDRGADDFADEGLDIMADRLRQRGVDFTYTIYPVGEHNNLYWSSHIEDYLDFYVDGLGEILPEPTPQAPSVFATNTPSAPLPTQETLLVPVVAFPSLMTSIDLRQLQRVANGDYDENLVLTTAIAQAIEAHPDVDRVSNAEDIQDYLWRNRTAYTLLPLSEVTTQYRIVLVDEMPVTSQLENYPFAGDTSSLTRLTLSGVTALTRNTRTAIEENGIDWATEAIQQYTTQSDIFHISNEVSFADPCPNSAGDLLGGSSSFCSLRSHFEIFNRLGVDVIELTGNHNNDYGYSAYEDTLTYYAENGYATVGGGATVADARTPYLVDHNGNRIAIVACNAAGPYYALANEDTSLLGGIRGGAADCDWAWLEATLPDLSQQVDVLIVSVQYVEVEDYQPLDAQQFDFRRLATLGADVVIGSQAHKPQTFEFYPTNRGETAFIHYGLGNFYFDQPFWGNQRFFLDTLYIEEGQLRGVELFVGIIDDLARPRLMTPDERHNFMFFMMIEQNGF